MPVPAMIEVDPRDRGPNLPPVIPVMFNPPEYTIAKGAQFAEIAQPGKTSWNLEPWRPVVDDSEMVASGCNPGAAEEPF